MGKIPGRLRSAMIGAVLGVMLLVGITSQSQTQVETNAGAPVPAQITTAKKIFIANAGTESAYFEDKLNHYVGGPNRAYDQFYSAVKAWPQIEIVSSPAEADIILELRFEDRTVPGLSGSSILTQLRLLMIDPKSSTTLWALTEHVEWAGKSKNRETNFATAMNELINDTKNLILPSSATPK